MEYTPRRKWTREFKLRVMLRVARPRECNVQHWARRKAFNATCARGGGKLSELFARYTLLAKPKGRDSGPKARGLPLRHAPGWRRPRH